jgi:ribosomal protein S18 acetylase RimI-like enzyme
MSSEDLKILVRPLKDDENIPYELLLLADPSKEMIDVYLKHSRVFVATLNANIIGAFVFFPLSANSVEIKNIAVKSELQGKGVGQLLLDYATEAARKENFKSICIGTANSSIGQLYLYQKKGYEITGIIKNFFIDHYPEPFYENGIQAKHMIMLIMQL